jgi:hypothetical protein
MFMTADSCCGRGGQGSRPVCDHRPGDPDATAMAVPRVRATTASSGRGQLDQELAVSSRQADREQLRARHRAGILSAANINC